jgi:c-di-GMP-binding flagellar brake protein YcgR
LQLIACGVTEACRMQHEEQLRAGETFLLRAGREYFLSTIESVADRSLEVSVPSKDYPPPGMRVSMDFHDDDGCTIYRTEVIRGPGATKHSARLKRPGPPQRVTHREYTRVETNVPVRFREMGTVAYREGTVINVSAGGMLLQATHEHEFEKLLEIELELPDSPHIAVLGQIVHKAEQVDEEGKPALLYGCKFVKLDRQQRKAIIQHVRFQFGGDASLP